MTDPERNAPGVDVPATKEEVSTQGAMARGGVPQVARAREDLLEGAMA